MIKIVTISLMFILLISSVVQGAPTELDPALPEPGEEVSKTKEPDKGNPTELENFVLAKPKVYKQEEFRNTDKFFYAYRQSMSPYLGLVAENGINAWQLGLNYHYINEKNIQREFGAAITEKSTGFFYGYHVWSLSPNSISRPFARAGLGFIAQGGDGPAMLIKIENYQVRVGAGYEYMVIDPVSLRVDGDLMFSSGRFMYCVNLSYVWAW